MSVQRIAARYAKSLVDLASEQGKMDTILADLNGFQEVAKNRDFQLMLKSPLIKSDKKKAIFDAIFTGKTDKLTEAFFDIVLKKGRESYLPAIAKEFVVQHKILNHISSVKLITASELSASAIEDIHKQVLASDATDENVEMAVEVDESLIGGFVLEFDNNRFDSSVASKLAALKKEFSKNQYTKEF